MEETVSKSQQKLVAEEFDAYRDTYRETINEALSFSGMDVDRFVRAKANHLIESVDRHFGPDRTDLSVLDIGCGIGQYHKLILPRFKRIAGVDVSAEAIKRAEATNPGVDYAFYDGNQLPFETGEFDVTYAICVLHHVPTANWQSFVAEMFRVTRPGGLAFLFEHNPLNPLTRKVVNDCPFDRDAVLVYQSQAQALFRQAGFSEIKTESILTIPAVDGLIKMIDRMFGRTKFGTQYCLTAWKN